MRSGEAQITLFSARARLPSIALASLFEAFRIQAVASDSEGPSIAF